MTHFENPHAEQYNTSMCGEPGPVTLDVNQVDCPRCRVDVAAFVAVALGASLEEDFDQSQACDHLDGECACPPTRMFFTVTEQFGARQPTRALQTAAEFYRTLCAGMAGAKLFDLKAPAAPREFDSPAAAGHHFLRTLRDRLDAILGDK